MRSLPIVALALLVACVAHAQFGGKASKAIVTDASKPCISCHAAGGAMGGGVSPAIVDQWRDSRHAQFAHGCAECHVVPEPGAVPDIDNPRYVVRTTWDKATGLKKTELVTDAEGKPVERPDIWKHGGGDVVPAVSPRTCAQCHASEVQQFVESRHSSAAQFIGSVDNWLGRYAEGAPAAIGGCDACHGSVLSVEAPGKGMSGPRYSAANWPNAGVGRVNADGSWGSCTACHARHEFSAETGRRPENCGRCHLGPDHPQKEIFEESKHGAAWRKSEAKIGVDKPGGDWVLGTDYWQAPTCSTCHMGPVAARAGEAAMPLTHDVGARIAWTLRPVVSTQPGEIVAEDGRVILPPADKRRQSMKHVCGTCHGPTWVENSFTQFDNVVVHYNEKFAKPATAVYDLLKKEALVDEVPMNERADYLYYELWHHEGRRARHGAAMGGPDYVQWHGFYDLTRNFYTELLPLAEELGLKAGKGDAVRDAITAILHGPEDKDWPYHKWTEGLTPEERAEMLEIEAARYRTPTE